MKHRMLPPVDIRYQTHTVNGRTYTGSPGAAVDVVGFDADMLSANGWIYVCPSGDTSERPTGTFGIYNANAGSKYFDTTLDKLIVSDGANWRDPATGNVA